MTTPMHRVVSAPSVPLVDFWPFISGDQSQKRKVAREIAAACETVGFFYLDNHGIPEARVQRIFVAAREFFSLPESRKMEDAIRAVPRSPRGYVPIGARHFKAANETSPKDGEQSRIRGLLKDSQGSFIGVKYPDLHETYKVELDLPADDPDIISGDSFHQLNKWPVGMPEWREAVLDYFSEIRSLSLIMMRCFALSLDLEENFFQHFSQKPLDQLSLLHYPAQSAMAREEEYGIHPHTDQTTFTILAQNDVGGLQVQTRAGTWIDVEPIPGTFIVNLGYMMARWTNDRFAATPHRVLNRLGRQRYSVPYFNIPDFDAVISPLPNCVAAGDTPKYPELHVGRAMLSKYGSDWVKA